MAVRVYAAAFMKKTLSILGVLAAGLSACGRPTEPAAGNAQAPAIVQPGAPGQASSVVSNVPTHDGNAFTKEDVEFMQGMIHHHNQALLMVVMIPSRTKTPELLAIGKKIQLSQSGEIESMKEWLTARTQELPMIMDDGTAMTHHGDMEPMPGMLTPEQMDALAASTGAKFDELFLTGMIQHHKGALKMVKDLRDAGGGKETNIGHFLDSVDNDQRMEIVRMYGFLGRPVEWK